MAESPQVRAVYHPPTSTFSYVAWDPESRQAVIVDPVLDYDGAAARTDTASAAALMAIVAAEGLQVAWILETHAHADHLSAAHVLHELTGAPVGIGRGIASVQSTFKEIYRLGADFPVDGRQFDRLFDEDDRVMVGNIPLEILATPGHTSDSITYLFGDAAFVGDTFFAPDYGTARCDFPGGDAATLFQSVQKLYRLPPETRLFLCHDYPPPSREPRCEWSIGEQRRDNVHIAASTTEADFVAMRQARDKTLSMPALILPAVQVNIRAGQLPDPDDNGTRYLRIPLDMF